MSQVLMSACATRPTSCGGGQRVDTGTTGSGAGCTRRSPRTIVAIWCLTSRKGQLGRTPPVSIACIARERRERTLIEVGSASTRYRAFALANC